MYGIGFARSGYEARLLGSRGRYVLYLVAIPHTKGDVVYLSRLEIFGFKSFAQKIDIEFGDGITAVVGPNGCGKTNVVDAIRWVLGEQRAGALRGGKMEDVIFAGAPTRKPLGMAEVSLMIENTRNILPIEFSEVTVTRRLFRSGESDYLLNKIPCRLMDITNLFMDTGMGPHAYAVIEQGMVDAILSERTEDRRRLFEEAAGITKYKIRRRAAWTKLTSVQQDLLRIEDIIGEVEGRVESLKRQERRARRYQRYAEELARLELTLGRHQYLQFKEEMGPLSEQIEAERKADEAATAHIAAREADVERLRLGLTERERMLSEATGALSRHIDRVHGKDLEIGTERERREGLERMIEQLTRQREETISRLTTAKEQRGRVDDALDGLAARASKLKKALARAEKEREEAEHILETRSSALEAQRTRLMEVLRDHAERSRKLERDRTDLRAVSTNLERLAEEERQIQLDLEVGRKMVDLATAGLAEARGKLDADRARREACSARLEDARTAFEGLEEERRTLTGRVERAQDALSLWSKIAEQYEGYSQSVRALMLDSPYSDRIRGTIADQVSVPKEYARAVECALGESLETLITEGTETAEEAIEFLKTTHKGRAAFLPADRVRGGNGKVPHPEVDGVFGWALDFVECDARTRPILERLLAGALVVRDLETALHLDSGNGSSMRIVTLDGEVVESDGRIVGGGDGDDEAGLLERKRQIERLREEIIRDAEAIEVLSGKIEASRSAVDLAGEALVECERDVESARERISELEREHLQGESEVNRAEGRAHALAEEKGRLIPRASELKATIEAQEKQLAEIERRRSETEQELEMQQRAVEGLVEDRRTRAGRAQELQVEAATFRQKHESLEQEQSRLKRSIVSFEEEIEQHRQEIVEVRDKIDALDTKRKRDEAELETMYAQQTELEQARDLHQEGYQELGEQTRSLEDELRELRRDAEARRKVLHDLQLNYLDLESRAREVRDRVREAHDRNVEEIAAPEDEGTFDPTTTERLIQDLRQRMRGLGAVNMAALEEYQVQKERYEFLMKERNDLLESEDNLKKTIAEVDRTARERFLETFEKIRENFLRTFREFFEGGDAGLSLVEGEDPLEADIEITARPRGKRLQNISLLSGGERALTAISLLFAIYLVKPSPFCILDEVDAPLDDANVDRFLRVIRRFSENTQFVIVTHNKRTMEEADRLHGITMEETGVSQLMSVELEKDGNGRSEAVGLGQEAA